MKTIIKIDGKTIEVDAAQLEKLQSLLADLGVSTDAGDDEEDSTDAKDEDEDGSDSKDTKDGEHDEDEDEDSTDAKDEDDSDSKGAKDSKGDSGTLDIKAITKSITDAVETRMSKKFDSERKLALDAVKRRGKLVADARGGLADSYVYEGRTDRQVMLDTIKARTPDFHARAGKLDDAELPGAFKSALATPTGSPTDLIKSDSASGKRRTMGDAIDLQARRQKAAQGCSEAGQFVSKHDDVKAVKHTAGGK